jgi:N-acetylglucosaminyldiphosphoundecaprenol N-acetyl-beta-D-mannosaminyltransferase
MSPRKRRDETTPQDLPVAGPGAETQQVDILGIRFPLWTRDQALGALLQRLRQHRTSGVCFPDMSSMNVACEQPDFRRLLQERLLVLNDGAGLAWASWRRGKPFPANLNGTDLTPALLDAAPAGTRVYLVGSRPDVIARARDRLSKRFTHIVFVGHDHGFFDVDGEEAVAAEIARCKPDVVMVGMGNPRQVRFIGRRLDDPRLQGILWLAVGGFFEYWGGNLRRAPEWARRSRLEWLYIVSQQPYKSRRYFAGIPRFLGRCLAADLEGAHDWPGVDGNGRSVASPTLRSHVKSLARMATARMARAAGAGDPDAPRILCYHGVSPHNEDEWCVTPDQLAAQMAELSRTRVPVDLAAIQAWLRGEADLPPRAVAVTFDDGYLDVLQDAAPILARFGVPGAVFVSPALVRGGASAAHPEFQVRRPLMDAAQVREIAAAGWTLGSHGMTHAPLAHLDAARARHEIVDSKTELEFLLGQPVTLLAYPYGTPGTVSAREHALAAEAGYDAAMVAITGTLRRTDDRFALPRAKVLGTDDPHTFTAILDGAMDVWRVIERTH